MESPSALAGRLRYFKALGALAAVGGEIPEQLVHVIELRVVDEVATFALLGDQAGVGELLEVKRQRGCRHAERLCDGTGREARFAADDKEPEDLQAQGLRKRGQGTNDIILFHIQRIVEVSD